MTGAFQSFEGGVVCLACYDKFGGPPTKSMADYIDEAAMNRDRLSQGVMQPAVPIPLLRSAPAKEGGLRYNGNKPRHSLISPWAMEGLAKVLTYGEKKYTRYGDCTCHRANELHAKDCAAKRLQSGADNWRKGLSWRETIDSLKRHLAAFEKGIDLDTEPFNGQPGSGLPHIDLLQCNAMFLSEFFHLKRGTDDRWKP